MTPPQKVFFRITDKNFLQNYPSKTMKIYTVLENFPEYYIPFLLSITLPTVIPILLNHATLSCFLSRKCYLSIYPVNLENHYFTKEQAKLAIFESIKSWYNRKRKHSALDNRSLYSINLN